MFLDQEELMTEIEFIDEDSEETFAAAEILNEIPSDIDKSPTEDDGDQPVQNVTEDINV
jgi:hypothetical protein